MTCPNSTRHMISSGVGPAAASSFTSNDLTYSLIVPSSSRALDSEQIYREVHEALRDSLNQFGLGAEVVAQSARHNFESLLRQPGRG